MLNERLTAKAGAGASHDARSAAVAIIRIQVTDTGAGKLAVTNLNANRQVCEPGAVLQFHNSRTGEKTRVTLDDRGGFPAGVTIAGKAGDVLAVAASDGRNNTDFGIEAGRLTVPGATAAAAIKDPALHKDELNTDDTPRFSTRRFCGPVFKNGVCVADVQQGQLANCYFSSAMAALAHSNPEALARMIKENGDGTYTVTFQEKEWSTGRYTDVRISVDGDLYVRGVGGPLYGAPSDADLGEKTMQLWFPLIEKAYALWKGSYHAIGSGGLASDVFQEVLGKGGQDLSIKYAPIELLWSTIKAALDARQPVAAGTFGEDQNAIYVNSGVHADHCYAVLGCKEVGGLKVVTLRNPWDGVFDLPLKLFHQLFQTLMYTAP